MQLSFLATLALIGTAVAAGGGGGGKLPAGAPCAKDGSKGVCQSGLCIQKPDAQTGKCK